MNLFSRKHPTPDTTLAKSKSTSADAEHACCKEKTASKSDEIIGTKAAALHPQSEKHGCCGQHNH